MNLSISVKMSDYNENSMHFQTVKTKKFLLEIIRPFDEYFIFAPKTIFVNKNIGNK